MVSKNLYINDIYILEEEVVNKNKKYVRYLVLI